MDAEAAVRAPGTLRDLLALLRPREWVKSGFVLAALFFTPEAMGWHSLETVLAVAALFALASSAVYVVNDVADREADRQHPRKRLRPVASGRVGVGAALALGGLLAAAALAGAWAMDAGVVRFVGTYLGLNLLYCLWLKHVSILDVMIIASGFVLRLLAGAAVIGATPSPWIVVMTGLLALFLALAKRRDDVVLTLDATHRRSLDGYNREFLDAAIVIAVGTTLVGYILYCLEPSVIADVGTDKVYYTVPFVLAGLLRYLQITFVEKRSGSPTAIVTSDPMILLALAGWVGMFGYLLYG
ncbi:MAG TPA: decaprenyl-phosphate phosphoribosyltransferase [Azospirillaceae bacterium]|nr:decaprenyl-phosphate phosphoribosyltransferase [Azospirillaceae bacterium]